jgi:hypothetical protein
MGSSEKVFKDAASQDRNETVEGASASALFALHVAPSKVLRLLWLARQTVAHSFEELDLRRRCSQLCADNRIRAPLARTPNANVAMSDRLFRARREDRPTSGPRHFCISLIRLTLAPTARNWRTLRRSIMPIQNIRPTSDVIRIAERVPAADRHLNPNEVKAITLIRLITMTAPEAETRQWGAGKLRPIVQRRLVVNEFRAHIVDANDWRLDRLIGRLPRRLRSTVRFLRQPSRRWLRIPMGLLLTLGGVLGFLPIVGFWMLPIGLVLLADDVQQLRSCRSRILDWVEHRRPRWLSRGSRPQ